MCGRYTLTAEPEVIQQAFDLDDVPQMRPRYNIAPTQKVPVITGDAPKQLSFMQWGLVPSWAKDPSIGSKMINARSETLDRKPSFREAFAKRRCLVPVDGFFEWRKDGNAKYPMYIHLKDRQLFAMAGLWETWKTPEGDVLQTCTIVTAEPNALVKQFHHRMAVILSPESYATWLDDGTSAEVLKALFAPYSEDQMTAYEVSSIVNNPNNDTPQVIEPYQSPTQKSLF